mgnify:CR=1 FL=1|jgi:uncharacterized membrane protein (DUF106 family)
MLDFKNLSVACLLGVVTWEMLNNRALVENMKNMKEEMTNLKEAQALTQAGLKTEKVNRLTQIRNIKK